MGRLIVYERICAGCGERSELGRRPKKQIQYCYRCAASRRNGTDLYTRMDAGTVRTLDGGCWIWTGHRTGDGYGRISVGGRKRPTHRINYERYVGPIRDGEQIDHLCRVRACCNPEHLEAVEPAINVLRSNGLAAINARKDECIHGHPFDLANTIFYRDSRGGEHRACLTCRRATYKRYDERRRGKRAS